LQEVIATRRPRRATVLRADQASSWSSGGLPRAKSGAVGGPHAARRLIRRQAVALARPELVTKYGYDTKFAMHALQLGYEGIELLTHRRLTLPVAEPNLTTLRAVKSGKINEAGAFELIEDAERRLRELVDRCAWEPDNDATDRFMVRAHLGLWRASGRTDDASGQLVRRV
jgi:hypothetical protein